MFCRGTISIMTSTLLPAPLLGWSEFDTFSSPIGELLLLGDGESLRAIFFEIEDHAKILSSNSLAKRSASFFEPTKLALNAFFSGEEYQLQTPLRPFLQGFQLEVVNYLPLIPRGQTTTYGQAAAALNRPGASRAVGSACAKNTIPLLLPCHRVVPASGQTGGYRGGPAVKKQLLDLEK